MYTYEEAYNATKEYFNGDELAAKVSVDKYQLRNSDGTFLEKTPADVHRRLASEFARIEKHKFHNPLSEETIFGFFDKYACIIPQGSPIFGIGNKEQIVSLSNCVHGESLVYTKELGLVKMKDIKPGLHVLTHRNRFKKVINHWSNGNRETYILSRTFSNKRPDIKTEQEMGRFLAVTPEHKILKRGGGWVSVNDTLNKQNKSFEVPKLKYSGNIPEVFPLSNGKHIITDENFYWLCGMYLAEGSIKKIGTNHPSVYFTLNSNETEFAEKINQISQNWFGHEAWIQSWDNYNFIQVNLFEEGFADLLNNLFGHGFNHKRIPEWVFGLEEKYIRALLDGFLCGDGTNYESLDDDNNTFSIANPTLAYELGLLSRNINKNVRFNFLCKGKLIKNRTINVSYSNHEDNTLFVKSPVIVEVFDMEVEEDHSFVAGDFICHNCFVIKSPEDSYGGILRADQELVQISKRRGGVGIDLSTLRPNKSKTRNSSKTSTGVASWMERYSNSIREVGQDGRRGALMLTLSVHHPDIETFINIKNDATKVTGANISVRLTDEFLKAVDNDEEYELRFPVDSKKPTYTRKIKAKDIWNKIVNSAWNRAEPGLLFWDNIIRESPTDCYELFVTISTNPCSEIPLSAYDSCRLISINLMSFIVNAFTKNAYFDYNMFYQTVMIAQRLMDDLVDLELECIDKILAKIEADPESKTVKSVERELWQKVRQSCIGGRRTGLGTTALGDCLAAINVKYGSNESISVVDRIYKTLKFGSYRSSVDMAKELGPFPEWNWESEEDNPFINRIKDETVFFDIPWEDHGCQIDNFIVSGAELYADIKKYGRRNVANLTNAPTGTISTQAGYQINNKWYHNTTSGIEPLFKTHYTRRKKGNPGDDNFRVDFKDQNGDCWMEFPVYHKGVEAWMNVTGNTEITDDCPYKGATAEEIDWIQRVKLQAAAQKHIDHAISSTINLPENVSKEEVAKIYKEAWKSGLKGITVYRDNCRTGVLITKQPEKVQNVDRPKELPCDVYHLTSKGTQYFVLIGLLDSKPYEIFAGKNGFLDKSVKSGKIIRKAKRMYKAVFDDADSTELCPITQSCSDHEETITRLTSALLRSGADIHLIVEQLEKVHGDMTSFAKIVARALKKYIKDGTKVDGEECPECNKKELIRSEGCKKCTSCGWTACL